MSILWLAIGAFMLCFDAAWAQTRVVTAPAAEGCVMSKSYRVSVNGKPVAVYEAPVWYPTYVKPFGGPYAFATFDFSGTADVTVSTDRPLNHVVVRPESRNVPTHVKGSVLHLTLTKPCQLSIEPDAKNGPLLLFANPIERGVPSRSSPRVRYYGPGLHDVGAIELGDGETLYLAAGAVVRGGVHARGKGIRILGRGILDGGKWERFKGPGSFIMHLDHCTDAVVDGIILKDSWSWTFVTTACDNVRINNVKICSTRCENNDGIDFVNSRRVTMTDSFIRSDDDCVAPKGLGEGLGVIPYPPVEDITIERCVLWTDRAHVWRLGCESRASVMRRMVFRDIDVIHYTDPTCPVINVQPAEGMRMEDVRFENIRVNHEGQGQFIELDPHATMWAKAQTPGTISGILFKDMALSGPPSGQYGSVVLRGLDGVTAIENVVFDNVTLNGQKLTQDSPNIRITGAVRGISFK